MPAHVGFAAMSAVTCVIAKTKTRSKKSSSGLTRSPNRIRARDTTGRNLDVPTLSADEDDRRAARGLPHLLRGARTHALPLVVADSARGRSLDPLHLGRDAAAEAVLLRREGAARAAVHHRAEGAARRREGHRPRRGRPHRAPRLDVRDARQLLVRRLLQGRRDRPRLGVRHRADGARPRPAVGERVRRRPGARARRGRGRRAGLASQGPAARADRPLPAQRQLLGPRRRDRARAARARSSTSTAARSTAAGSRRAARTARTATATSSSGTSSSWSSTATRTGR